MAGDVDVVVVVVVVVVIAALVGCLLSFACCLHILSYTLEQWAEKYFRFFFSP